MPILSREDTGPRPQRSAGAAKTGLSRLQVIPLLGRLRGPAPNPSGQRAVARPFSLRGGRVWAQATADEMANRLAWWRADACHLSIPAASSARRTAARPATGTRPVGTGPCRWTKRTGSSSINRMPSAVRAAVQRTARAQGAAASATRAAAPHLRLFSRSASSSSFM